MANKDILFYSNFCEFSKEIVTLIIKKSVRSSILLVCIDNGKYPIPPIVDRVPCLITAKKDMVFIENDLVKYIEGKARQVGPKDDDIGTFSWEGGRNFSEGYSFVTDETNGNMTNMGYTLLGDGDDSLMGKKLNEDDVLKQSKFDISAYDSYISSRNRDEEQIKKAFNVNNVYNDRI